MQGNNFVISLIFDKVLEVLRYCGIWRIFGDNAVFVKFFLRFCGIQNPPMSPSVRVPQERPVPTGLWVGHNFKTGNSDISTRW